MITAPWSVAHVELLNVSVWDIKGRNSVKRWMVRVTCEGKGCFVFVSFPVVVLFWSETCPLHLTLQDDNDGHRADDLSALGPAARDQVHLLWTGWDGVHAVTEEPHLPLHTHPKSSIPIRALLQGGSGYVTMPRPCSRHGCCRTCP